MSIPIKIKNTKESPSSSRKVSSSAKYESSLKNQNFYGSTPNSYLKIPNVNSISDLNDVDRVFHRLDSNTSSPRKDSTIKYDSYSNSVNLASTSNKFVKTIENTTTVDLIDLNYDLVEENDGISLFHYMCEQTDQTDSQVYESLDYEINENVIYLQEKKRDLKNKQKPRTFLNNLGIYFSTKKELARWFVIFLIGFFTALTACFIVVLVSYFSELKFKYLTNLFDVYTTKKTTSNNIFFNQTNSNQPVKTRQEFFDTFIKLQIPLVFWILTSAIPVFFGSALVTYLSPVAAGSGIPAIKTYLNGCKIPHVIRVKTYIAKVFGVIFTVVGGLCSGKEGPMIHSGSVIAGFSQGKLTTLKIDFNIFRYFREDHEKRDFVAAGASAGVATAFSAPIGGVLFSLEEAASFWNQLLTWRIFFCSLVSTFTLNFIMSIIKGQLGQMSYSGLINFGKFENVNYELLEIPIYIFMGISGGLIGVLFNHVNYKLTLFRMKYINKRPLKVLEAMFVASLTALLGFLLIIFSNECSSVDDLKKEDHINFPLQLNCKDNEFSTMGSLFINTPESLVINLFHLDAKLYSTFVLAIFLVVYFFLSVITYGLSISSGIFIPALLIGSVYGRIVALLSFDFLKHLTMNELILNELVSKFALIGAASVLGGIVRMTLSLTVILMETTGNLTLGLPLMICLIFAKMVGDSFNEGLYDIHMNLQKIPFLHCEPHLNNKEIDEDEIIFISQLMKTPVITMKKIETVRNVIEILQNESHYGFPIVDDTTEENDQEYFNDSSDERLTSNSNAYNFDLQNVSTAKETKNGYITQIAKKKALGQYGKLRGFVLRWQLIVLLQKKIFDKYIHSSKVYLNSDIFRDAYPRYDNINKVIKNITEVELDYKIDLSHVMNPSPYSIYYNSTYERAFRLFRALGLRHLCVIDDTNNVVGIITRKDLCSFKIIKHKTKRYIQKYSETLLKN